MIQSHFSCASHPDSLLVLPSTEAHVNPCFKPNATDNIYKLVLKKPKELIISRDVKSKET
jgi:hypothetical protein